MTENQAAESITALMSGYSTMTDVQKADAIEAVAKLAGMVDDEPATRRNGTASQTTKTGLTGRVGYLDAKYDTSGDPIVPATVTVREYLEGEEEGPVFLHTHCGVLQVTGVHFFHDGPWLVTGHGLGQASWCASYGERLYFDKAEAERSAS
jgi:hypothetical protein